MTEPNAAEEPTWKRPAVAFLLFDREAPTPAEVSAVLSEVFEGSYPVTAAHGDEPASVQVEDVTVVAQPTDGPVPGGEAEQYATDIAMWNGDTTPVATHRSHVVVAGLREEDAAEPEDPRLDTLRRELSVAHVTAALTALPGAVAVFVGSSGATLPAIPYRDVVTANPIPVPALVGVRAGWRDDELSCAYTTGLGRFGRADMEWLDAPMHPDALFGKLCDLVAFSLGSGVVLQPGQRVEVSDDEVLRCDVGTSPLTGWEVLQLVPDPDGDEDAGTAHENGETPAD